MKMNNYTTIDEYITNFPPAIRENLQKIRQTIKQAAPEATEKISYGIPTFTFHGNLVHFAAYDTHYGFYPGSSPIAIFAEELSHYETSKGTIKFPLDAPLPLELIARIVAFRAQENLAKRK